ncbi:universal stress protein [Ornithinibacillus halotolerans]|uniref:Universal stress protein n=1 Tax=Ornithinibacillus halotolerans TaxID=1274357 RepID=A0A916WB87_9BACI|nr:universal stress protein [Ornithinibacillus halotolerans]GGA82187.1 universal stress protein [Ornithinibacillus halotolerans]
MNTEYKNILVAIDGSKASENAFNKALDIVKRNNAHLIIAHVIEYRSFAYADSYNGTLAEQAEEYAKDLVDSYVESATEVGITNISRCIEYGSPKVKITKDIPKLFEIDLIICGATGMNAVERFLIGSVSEGITRYAPCDVLVVR